MPGPGQGHARASPSARGIRWPSCFISPTTATRRRFSFSFCGREPAQFPFKAHFLSSCQYSQLIESASRWLAADEPTAELPGRRVPQRKTCKRRHQEVAPAALAHPRKDGRRPAAPPPYSCTALMLLAAAAAVATAAANGNFSKGKRSVYF